ncbi:MAG: hypothetical protein ABIW82_02570 [Dokdonella sp.]
MRTRRIAVVGLKDDAAHAFHSMLKIVDGRAQSAWSLSAPDDADVLMAGVDANEPAIERWARTDKPLIAVHQGTEGRPLTPFTLHHPFRVMQLLGVLDEVERTLAATPAVPPMSAAPKRTDWAFCESLRLLSRRSACGQRYSASAPDAEVFVQDDMAAYYISVPALHRLRSGDLHLPALRIDSANLPNDFVRRPVFELAWFSGLHEGAGLAPWLEPEATFHLRRWPDFGMLRATRQDLTLAALLSQGSFTRQALAQSTGKPVSDIDRFISACATSGILASNALSATLPAPFRAPTRFGGLIRSLRRHLGLAE